MDWVTVGKEWGVVGIAVCGIIALIFLLLKWVLEQFKEELVNNRKERAEYLITLQIMRNDMCEHNVRAKEFQTNVQLEHKEMIISLGRINGYKQ
jgi:hypothetical protein